MKQLLLLCLFFGSASQASFVDTGSGTITFADTIGGFLEAPTDKTYTIDEYAKFAYTINDLTTKLASGTVTVAIKINGTNVTGLSAISVSGTQATSSATAANTVAVGDRVTLVTSSSSSPVDFAFDLKYTR